MCVVSPLVIVALVTVAPGVYHYYVCFVCSITVFCGSSKLPFCASVHCVLLSLVHMLPRHFGVYLCCCYRPFVSVVFSGTDIDYKKKPLAFSKLLTYPLNTVYNNRALTVSENIKFLGMHLH